MSKFIIIDGNAIIHRAYHALPPLTTREGLMVNAVYGFTSMLIKVWNDLKPDYIAVAFDVAGKTFRHAQYDAYKGKRVKADQELYDQIPLVWEVVRGFNVPIYTKEGYEADDVIGTVVDKVISQKPARNASRLAMAGGSKIKSPIEVFVVTGDMDMVDDQVRVYTLRKGMSDTVVYDEKAVRERYGFGPEMIVDYKALRGDPSDNIPGVPGIGEKTATELIKKFGGVEEIYNKLTMNNEQLTGELRESVIKKLKEGEESARMSKQLATIDKNVPDLDFDFDACRVREFDREKLMNLFKKFEFSSLIRRLPGQEKTAPGSWVRSVGKRAAAKKEAAEFTVEEIKNDKEIKSLMDMVLNNGWYSAKILLNSKDIFSAELQGIVVVTGAYGFYLPAGLNPITELQSIFQNSKIELVGHDLKDFVKNFFLQCHPEEQSDVGIPYNFSRGLSRPQSRIPLAAGPQPSTRPPRNDTAFEGALGGAGSVGMTQTFSNRLFDIQIASYLLNPGTRAHDAESVVLKMLGQELPKSNGVNTLFGVDYKLVARELLMLAETKETLGADLIRVDNLGLFEKIEMPLIPVLAEMELNGIAVDLDKLAELSEKLKHEIGEATKAIYSMAGQEFNIASPLQLREILFDRLEIPVENVKKGKTGLSTSAEELEKLRGLHPIIDSISEYRELAKLQNTYVDVLPTLVHPKTNRIHTSFNQAVTATGRLSSSDPNLQNIPIRTELGHEIRKAFIAEEGNILLSADYSQIELRIVASLAKDKKLMEIFAKGEDVHRATAAAIHKVALEKVTPEMRRAAKEVNFGVLYGMGAYGLAWRSGLTREDARSFIDRYFEEFNGVKEYIDRTLEFTKKEGYCETLFGRRRYIPELNSKNFQLRSSAERMAINHPIQGTAADLMKMAMVNVSEKLKVKSEKFDNERVKMILQVHDELVVEVKKGVEEEIGKMLKETMENIIALNVPIEVEVHYGQSWGEMK